MRKIQMPDDYPERIQYVYFARRADNNQIKIGTSRDVPTRLKALTNTYKTPFVFMGCIEGGEGKEAELHQEFIEFNTDGEFFVPNSDLLAFIEQETCKVFPPKEYASPLPIRKSEKLMVDPQSDLGKAILGYLSIPDEAIGIAITVACHYRMKVDE